MRPIDADKLNDSIDALFRHVEKTSGTHKHEAKAALLTVMQMVKKAPTVGGWISAHDRLPEFGEAYFAACRSLVDDREPWVIEGIYGLVTHNKPWGVPLISWGQAEVYAWQPKIYPEPPEVIPDEG